MRSISIVLLTAFFLAAVCCASAHADPSASYLNVTGGVGAGYFYLYPKDIQIRDYYKGGMTYKAFLGFRAESGISAIGDISYYSEGNRSPLAPYGTALTIIPVTASVAYYPFKKSSVSPYLGAGVGLYYINESDPDYNYLQTTKFGKHIFAGADLYIDRGTIIRAELRQTFIDPVSSALLYQASFSGLTASLNIAVELPFFGKGAPMTTEEAEAYHQRRIAENEHRAVTKRMDDIDAFFDQRYWDHSVYYYPWTTPTTYFNPAIQPTQQQIDEQRAKAQQAKAEQDRKRQDYLNQRQQLRQDKKGSVNPSR
ncbi:MAG: outer membrane beta-barrel protein [Candidatus Margulisiibacteriota bacterium]